MFTLCNCVCVFTLCNCVCLHCVIVCVDLHCNCVCLHIVIVCVCLHCNCVCVFTLCNCVCVLVLQQERYIAQRQSVRSWCDGSSDQSSWGGPIELFLVPASVECVVK